VPKTHSHHLAAPARLASMLGARGTVVYTAGPRPPDTRRRRLGTIVRPGRKARQLRAAGFTSVTRYWRRPGYRPFEIYVPLAEPRVVQYYLRTAPRPSGVRARVLRLGARLAAHGGVLAHLVDDPVIIARRP
jgi:hypothetical protein